MVCRIQSDNLNPDNQRSLSCVSTRQLYEALATQWRSVAVVVLVLGRFATITARHREARRQLHTRDSSALRDCR